MSTEGGLSPLIAVARGDAPPDLVIEGARVLSVFTREWLELDVAVSGGRIAGLGEYDGGERVDARGKYLVPGFIDAHVHIESSKLTPAEFARAVVPHGTTAVVTDPHEVANVLGRAGVEWMLEASEHLPLDVFVMAPSCVPASDFESPDRPARARRHGGDPAPSAGARRGGDDELPRRHRGRRRRARAARCVDGARHADGHAPGVTGRALDAYVAAGIRSDHEATTFEEALEKRRRGMWVLIREASNARNLRDLLPLVERVRARALRVLHRRPRARPAVPRGPHRPDVPDRRRGGDRARGRAADGDAAPGALPRPAGPRRRSRPACVADLVLLDDLEDFHAARVYKDGVLVAAGGRGRAVRAARRFPTRMRETMRVGAAGPARVRDLAPRAAACA